MPLVLLCALLLLPLELLALPSGESVLPPGGVLALEVSNNVKLGKGTPKEAQHPEFKQSLELETLGVADNVWDVQAATRNGRAIAKDDVLLASFWVRATQSKRESGEAVSMLVFELARDPWEKSLEQPVRAGSEWRQIHMPFKAARDYAAGEAQLIFRMGYTPQAFEVGGLTLSNFKKAVRIEDLPVTKITYQGREAGASWRAWAADSIQKHRTGVLSLRVLDKKGRPVQGVKLRVTQKRNAFHFGSTISGDYLYNRRGIDDSRYISELTKNFNTVTEENAWKWPPQTGDWGSGFSRELAQLSLTFAAEHGLFFRGHVLFWPSWRNSPKSLRALEKDPKALRQAVLKHVEETAAATGELAGHWDVINEPYDNHEITDILGEELLVDVFKAARKGNRHAKLYINDYSILAGGGGDSGHRRHYETTIKKLLAAKVDLQGIGMQGHFGSNLTGMDDAKAILDRFAALGPKIAITEYDVTKDDLVLAGDYTRDILTLIYAHPSTEAFVSWGFWDGAHWESNSAFFHSDWTPKPALKAWQDLVLGEWAQGAQGLSSETGSFEPRLHLGDYEIEAEHLGKTKSFAAKLASPSGAKLDLTLP